ncbi:MAG: hypothetical protein NT018_04280 [Armatimonadetes bacterium]|nr:hypothetical protein [Armatimonadota bacterium]
MRKHIIKVIFCTVLIAVLTPGAVQAESNNTDLQAQITELREKLTTLEKGLAESQKAAAPTVTAGTKGSKVKIDGRIFVGIFDTGQDGAYPHASADASDAKLRFTFNPAKNITIVNRLNTTGAKSVDFDYFYADFAQVGGPSNTLRLGQRKIDVGQETWADNPIDNMLITNSVSHVSGYGTGLATLGRFKGPDSPMYEVGFVNGPKGVMVRPSAGLPFNWKLGVPLPNNLFASASYFSTGTLGAADSSAITVAEVSTAPTGATSWSRNLWELDVRYNYGQSGIRSMIPTGTLPPLMLGATYGRFLDDATGVSSRSGNFWFTEALVRLNPKLYAATRYSVTDLSGSSTAKLGKSPVAVNSYKRTSIGLDYVLTELTQVKIEYTINDTSGGASDPNLNQFGVGVATKF